MRRLNGILVRLLVAGILIATTGVLDAESAEQFVCDEEGGGGGQPQTGTLTTYIVYVSYPGDRDSLIAISASGMISHLTSYMDFVTYGNQHYAMSVLRRLDDPNKAWKLGAVSDDEQQSYNGNWEFANRDVMRRVYNRYHEANPSEPSVWMDADKVIVIHYSDAFCILDRYPGPPCEVSGRGILGVVAPPEWEFTGNGVTLMFMPFGDQVYPHEQLDPAYIPHEGIVALPNIRCSMAPGSQS